MLRCAQAVELTHRTRNLPYDVFSLPQTQSTSRRVTRFTTCNAFETTKKAGEPLTLYERKHEVDEARIRYEPEHEDEKPCFNQELASGLNLHKDKGSHAVRSGHPAEQDGVGDARASRGDPLEFLPLELIIIIMQFGQAMDDHFVLKSSWTSHRWRQTLTQRCPELWRTLTITSENSKKMVSLPKMKAWQALSQCRIESLVFRHFDHKPMKHLLKGHHKYVSDIKHLTISVTDQHLLKRFAERFRRHLGNVVSLSLQVAPPRTGFVVATARSSVRFVSTHSDDLCFLPRDRQQMRENLQTLKLEGVHFKRLPLIFGRVFFVSPFIDQRYLGNSTNAIFSYSSLKHLTVRRCVFDNVYDTELFTGTNDHRASLKYQYDPLHVALRAAPALVHLEVSPTWTGNGRPAWSGLGKRITLLQLQTAILPPPSLWSIDIVAPNLTSLVFQPPFRFCRKSFAQHDQGRGTQLIPALDESPVPMEALSNLRNVEFICYNHDTEYRLQQWLSRLTSVKTLTIRSMQGGKPWPLATATIESSDTRAAFKVVAMLTEHPEWCPKLQELELERCFVTENNLVSLVRERKTSALCMNLDRVVIKDSFLFCTETRTTLPEEIVVLLKDGSAACTELQPEKNTENMFENISRVSVV